MNCTWVGRAVLSTLGSNPRVTSRQTPEQTALTSDLQMAPLC